MDSVRRSPQSGYFGTTAQASDVAEVFIAHGEAPKPAASHLTVGRAESDAGVPRYPHVVETVSVWWGNWIPVAATGWGALVLIAPLLVAQFLLGIFRPWSRP